MFFKIFKTLNIMLLECIVFVPTKTFGEFSCFCEWLVTQFQSRKQFLQLIRNASFCGTIQERIVFPLLLENKGFEFQAQVFRDCTKSQNDFSMRFATTLNLL